MAKQTHFSVRCTFYEKSRFRECLLSEEKQKQTQTQNRNKNKEKNKQKTCQDENNA